MILKVKMSGESRLFKALPFPGGLYIITTTAISPAHLWDTYEVIVTPNLFFLLSPQPSAAGISV